MISGRCTKCNKWFRVPDGTAGWIGECRGCGNKFHVPTVEQYKDMMRRKILSARMQGLDGFAAVALATSRIAVEQEVNPNLDTHFGDEMEADAKTQKDWLIEAGITVRYNDGRKGDANDPHAILTCNKKPTRS